MRYNADITDTSSNVLCLCCRGTTWRSFITSWPDRLLELQPILTQCPGLGDLQLRVTAHKYLTESEKYSWKWQRNTIATQCSGLGDLQNTNIWQNLRNTAEKKYSCNTMLRPPGRSTAASDGPQMYFNNSFPHLSQGRFQKDKFCVGLLILCI